MCSIVNRFIWLTCLLLLVLQSCHKKIAYQKSTKKDTVALQKVVFNTYQGKGKLNYTHKEQSTRNVVINVRMKKDSIIWINLSSVGITAARLFIQRDSLTLINFIDKSYSVFDYTSLNQLVGFKVDFSIVQALLLGNPIALQSTKKQHVQQQNDHIVLRQTVGSLNLTTHILASTKKIDQLKLHTPSTNNSLTIKYADFTSVGDQILPKKTALTIQYNDNRLGRINNYNITISYSTIKVNSELKFPFHISKRYERK